MVLVRRSIHIVVHNQHETDFKLTELKTYPMSISYFRTATFLSGRIGITMLSKMELQTDVTMRRRQCAS